MKLATLRDGTRDGALVVVRRDGVTFARAHDVARTLQAALDAWERTEPACGRSPSGSTRARSTASRSTSTTLPRRCPGPTSGWTARPTSTTSGWCARRAAPSRRRRWRPIRSSTRAARACCSDPPTTWCCRTPPGAWISSRRSSWSWATCRSAPGPPTPASTSAWSPSATTSACGTSSPPSWPRASASSRASRPPPSARSPSPRTSSAAPGATGERTCESAPRSTAGWSATPTPGPRCTSPSSSCSSTWRRPAAFTAGTLLGSGTVSNADRARGISCLAERRMIETIEQGKPTTPFMAVGDRMEIEIFDAQGRSLFGRISQTVRAPG